MCGEREVNGTGLLASRSRVRMLQHIQMYIHNDVLLSVSGYVFTSRCMK